MEWITNEEIEKALSISGRQYFVGKLDMPQDLVKKFKGEIEIGISNYPSFTADKPHVHPVCTDYTFVLKGQVKIRLLDGSLEEHTFKEGDFYVIPPGTPHVTKNQEGTQVLFIKSPSMNDKTLVEVDEDVQNWMKSW